MLLASQEAISHPYQSTTTASTKSVALWLKLTACDKEHV